MKLRYYAEAETDVDHRRTLELLESIAGEHAVPVEVIQVDPQRTPPADFPGATETRPLEDAWDDFTYNTALQNGLGAAPSQVYTDPEDIVGNVGIVVDGDLVWATRFWGTHHGWGPVDPEKTAIGFLEEVEARGTPAIAERIPFDDWTPEGSATDGDDATAGPPAQSSVPEDVEKPTRDAIRDICTAQSFQRGVGYFEDGRVRDLSVDGTAVEATVLGSREYRTTVDLAADGFDGWCSCPYDYAGDCKHIVAVLLSVADRFEELIGSRTSKVGTDDRLATSEGVTGTGDGERLDRALSGADAETLRAFLQDVLAADDDLRERFLATVGTPVEKSVADYKRDIDRQFEDAAGRRGVVEYDTHIDFGEYYDLADAYRESGEHGRALDIYRALAEAIRENLGRIDDSSGHYGREIERAVETYAECLRQADPDADERREHVDYLFGEYESAEFGFVRAYYDDALRTVCETTDDLEYLLSLVQPHVPTVEPSDGASGSEADTTAEAGPNDTGTPDSTPGPLEPGLFTGEALELDRLAAGPLAVEDFVGETVAAKLADSGPAQPGADSAETDTDTDADRERGRASPGRAHNQWRTRDRLSGFERDVLSTYLWVLSELDERDRLQAVLEDVYTERTGFYRQYVDVLLADGQDDRAREIIEEGLDEFPRSAEVHRLAAEFFRDRDDKRYRDVLQTLFVRFEDWDAYDELKAACSDEQWASVRHDIVSQLGRLDPERLIDIYRHESERESAFEKVLDSGNLDTLRRYRAELADVDPERYFETYRDNLEPYLADETGREHYRTVIDHLRELKQLGFEVEFEAFLDHLTEKHSNRPAFLDELEKGDL